ncbi:GH3 domain-containing protein [Camarhynchus parvulus]|uniref:GH3 domain-containing protein n=1 Tax=Geospiza parvula TaxID=87175 RepID=UPI001237C25E|nr:GH3 domain-containing protein [Camarhynchus parvulus]
MLVTLVAVAVAVAVAMAVPALRHRLVHSALRRAGARYRRRLEDRDSDVRLRQERRLRRLLGTGTGTAGGWEEFQEQHPLGQPCRDEAPGVPLPSPLLWALLPDCWDTDPRLQGSLLYLDALGAAFPRALARRGTAVLHWSPGCPRAPAGWPLPTLYCTPAAAAGLPSRAAALRLQLLFALRQRALHVLEAGLAAELHDALLTLRTEWPRLAQELELGRLSPQPGLPEELREELQALLSPAVARAAELREQCAHGFEGIALRLWPRLEVVVVRTMYGSERLYCDSLRQAECRGLPFYCPFYQAAGALLGVNLWPAEPVPRFVLCPDWAFCEFLPCLASKEPRTVLLDELWEGREYGLVVTAQPGEYRCRTGEVLKVTGFHKQCPMVEPVRRESQTLSVRGESIPEEQFCQSLCRTLSLWPGARLIDYVCVESSLLGDSSGPCAPHYEVFLELQGLRDLSEVQRYKLDQCLQEDFPIYKSFRFKGSIGPLRLHLVRPRSFTRLREALGSPVPMPRVLREEQLLQLIQGAVIS